MARPSSPQQDANPSGRRETIARRSSLRSKNLSHEERTERGVVTQRCEVRIALELSPRPVFGWQHLEVFDGPYEIAETRPRAARLYQAE